MYIFVYLRDRMKIEPGCSRGYSRKSHLERCSRALARVWPGAVSGLSPARRGRRRRPAAPGARAGDRGGDMMVILKFIIKSSHVRLGNSKGRR